MPDCLQPLAAKMVGQGVQGGVYPIARSGSSWGLVEHPVRRDYGYMVCNDPCRLDEDPYCTSTRTVYDHRIRGAVKGAGLFFECKII